MVCKIERKYTNPIPVCPNRRVEFALGEIREAMGLLDGRTSREDNVYHAYRALVRAQDYLTGESEPPKEAP